MTQQDLFTRPHYPSSPGWKQGQTSREAAEAVAEDAETLRARCLEVLATGDYTADEVAEKLGRTPFSCRPRFSELLKQGKIYATGGRRPNRSGKSAMVWRKA